MKVLIFGGAGMLGHKLVQRLAPSNDVCCTIRSGFESIERFGIFRADRTLTGIDVEDAAAVRRAVEVVRPDVVVNAVGIVKQVPSAKDVVTTLNVNSILPHRLAALSAEHGFRLICISTDCVFDGRRGRYRETDIPNADDLYGRSKILGEVIQENCLTLRTSIIGRELTTSHSLLEWFLSNRGGAVDGYANAIYSGFPTVVFADIILSLLSQHRSLAGLYHVSSEPIDKYTLLRLINEHFAANINVQRSDDFKIDRSLDSSKFRTEINFTPRSWEEMVALMAADATPYDSFRI